MKYAFNKIKEIIYSIDSTEQVDVCEVLINNFNNTYGNLANDFSFILVGILEATKYLKFKI
tara:strand:+ start:1565 stop:1747 length:183 start_codon:yes stop_codon:yes gene_type:complete